MSYEKQTWNKYDDLKTEEENIANGAVVTDNRMNHMESGIGDNDTNLASHLANTANPHKVTAAQVGLGSVQNFGLATEDEAKQGISNAKYMTPSLTQAVLSANINSIAYANSADGTDRFSTIYPRFNLLKGTRVPSSTPGRNEINQRNLLYWFDNGKNVQNQGLSVGDTLTCTFDWTVTNPTSCTFLVQLNESNWQYLSQTISITSENKSGHSEFSFVVDTNFLSGIANGVQSRIDNLPTDSVLTISNFLFTKGSTATPYMTSASEATTADWPKYVGFSNTVKTNKSASDYTWFPVKDSELTNKVESHINNKSNPHVVTASQVGAYSKQEIDTKLSKAVMADDSGKVAVNDLNVNGKISDLGMSNFTPRTTTWSSNGVNIAFTRVGPLVIGVWGGSQSNVAQGFTYTTPVPSGFRPNTQAKLLVIQSAVSNINIDTNGTVKYWGVPATNGNLSGTLAYFTNDPFPES